MKKISIVATSILATLAISASAGAVDGPKVLTLETAVNGATINYNGTMEDGSHAVKCWLYNESGKELDMHSSPVDNHVFADGFDVEDNGEYTVTCANYEGGDFKSATATVARKTYPLTVDLNGGTATGNFEFPDFAYEGDVFDLGDISDDEIVAPKGKVFDAYEINGKRYEVGEKYTVTGAMTAKLLWKSGSAEEKEEEKADTPDSPNTSDQIMAYIASFAICSLGIIVAIIVAKHGKKNEA